MCIEMIAGLLGMVMCEKSECDILSKACSVSVIPSYMDMWRRGANHLVEMRAQVRANAMCWMEMARLKDPSV